jgi:nucleotide-binding universal stress UspA family protein
MRVQTILHPTDHSEQSRAALRYAVALAHDYGARLLILHIVPDFGLTDLPPGEPATAWATPPAAPGGRACIEYLIGEGDPVTTVLRTAAERKCDLIVLGSQPDRGWRRWLHGTRAERVVREAPCPVLVVKEAMTPPCGSLAPVPAGRPPPTLPVSSAG